MLILFTAVSRKVASLISSGGLAMPLNRIMVSVSGIPSFNLKNRNVTVTLAPFQPTDRSSSEKCESAFAKVTEILGIASTPMSEDVCIWKRLCSRTLGW